MKSSPNYMEYIYLVNFQDPHKAFRELNGFPHVLYRAMTFGDWNVMVITNRLMDISKLVGFEKLIYRGIKYCSYTPHEEFTEWDEYFERVYDQLHTFRSPLTEDKIRQVSLYLTWNDDEWKLFHAFKNNLRRKVTPTLRKNNIRYETYSHWYKTFQKNCRANVGIIAGGGRTEKPFLKAGRKYFAMKSKNKLWPIVCGQSMNAVDHPHGGTTSSKKKYSYTVSRHAPPGAKVGAIAAKRSGRKKR